MLCFGVNTSFAQQTGGDASSKQQDQTKLSQTANQLRQQVESNLQSFENERQKLETTIDQLWNVPPKLSATDELMAEIQKIKNQRRRNLEDVNSETEALLQQIRELGKIPGSQAPPKDPLANTVFDLKGSGRETSELPITQNDQQLGSNNPLQKSTPRDGRPVENPSDTKTPSQTNTTDSGDSNNNGAANLRPILSENPTNKLALANNLAAAGNYQTALEIYVELAKEKPVSPQNHAWIKYQAAVCYRNLGRFEVAERYFRELANSKLEDITTSTGKWWLERIEKRESMQLSIEKMDSILSEFAESEKEGNKNEQR